MYARVHPWAKVHPEKYNDTYLKVQSEQKYTKE
jgi:hypothetical protein